MNKQNKIIITSDKSSLRPETETGLRRFPAVYRPRMTRFAGLDRAFADLVISFPGLAFALATHYNGKQNSMTARKLIREGHSMIGVADAYGLPRWLRKIPPEAFTRHLPDMSTDAGFHKRIANLMPRNQDAVIPWFGWVLYGLELAGSHFALWLARQQFYVPGMPSGKLVLPLALYARHTSDVDFELWRENNHAGIARIQHWHGNIGFAKALDISGAWLTALQQECFKTDSQGMAPWIRGGQVNSYQFVPLTSQAALTEEGEIMENCVGDYINNIKEDLCRIFSIRRGKQNVATLSITRSPGNAGDILHISELEVAGNSTCPKRILDSVNQWLEEHKKLATQNNSKRSRKKKRKNRKKGNTTVKDNFSRKKWQNLWQPYAQDRQVNPSLLAAALLPFDEILEKLEIVSRARS